MPAPGRDDARQGGIGLPDPGTGAVRWAAEGPIEGANRGRPVFRVRGTMAVRLGRAVSIPILLLGGIAAGPLGLPVSPLSVVAVATACGLLALVVGRRIPDPRCSEPRCGAPLPPDRSTCKRCGGTVAGEIDHPHDRLAALERWERTRRAEAEAAAAGPGANRAG